MTKMTKMTKIRDEDFESKVQSPKPKVQSRKFKVRGLNFKVEEVRNSNLKISRIFYAGLMLLILMNFACVNQSLKGNKNVAAIVEENNLSDYEKDLRTMETANFDYIFVFRRKDGAVLNGEDKKYVKANSALGTNRFLLTDGDKAVIAGSKYAFSRENLEALRSRFLVEDFSKAKPPEASNNSNANR